MRVNSIFLGSLVESPAAMAQVWKRAESRALGRCKLPVVVFEAAEEGRGRLVLIREADLGRLSADRCDAESVA